MALLAQYKSDAQVVIKDFDPDVRMMDWNYYVPSVDTVKIDLDENGIADLLFYKDYAIFEPYIGVELNDAVIALGAEHSDDPSSFNVYAFEEGDVISEDNFWTNGGQRINSGYTIFYSSSYGGCSFTTDSPFSKLRPFLALKLNIEGSVHYGWLRLYMRNISGGACSREPGSPLVVYDFGYEAQPDSAIVCNAHSLNEDDLFDPYLFDVYHSETFEEFGLRFFSSGTDYSELRVFFVPDIDDVINFSTSEALSLSPPLYTSISADTVEESETSITYFSSLTRDINGDAFSSKNSYSAFILKMPAEGDTLEPFLSAPLSVIKAEEQHCLIDLDYLLLHYDAGNLSISFSADEDESDISMYAAGLLPDHVFYHWYDEVEYDSLDAIGYKLVPKTWSADYEVSLEGITTDMYGNMLIAGVEYDPVIIGFGDGYYRDLMCFQYNDRELILQTEMISNTAFNIFQSEPGFVNVQLENFVSGKFNLRLANISGQVIKEVSITESDQVFSFKDLPDGLYIATITENSMVVDAVKIVLQQ